MSAEFPWMSPAEIERTKQFIQEKSAETTAKLERASAKLDRRSPKSSG